MRNRIVEDGRRRLQDTPEYRAAAAEARRAVEAEFAPLFAVAGRLGRARLCVLRWLAVRRALDALAPRDALYSHSGVGRDGS